MVRAGLEEADEADALATLMRLHGVQARVGSAILAVFRPDRYTVMDWRAWESLRSHGYSKDLEDLSWQRAWPGYLAECERIAKANRVRLRRLDQATVSSSPRGSLDLERVPSWSRGNTSTMTRPSASCTRSDYQNTPRYLVPARALGPSTEGATRPMP